MSLSADDIKTHVRKLEKAVKDEMPASHIIDLLEALKKGVQATEAILRVRDYIRPGQKLCPSPLAWCSPQSVGGGGATF